MTDQLHFDARSTLGRLCILPLAFFIFTLAATAGNEVKFTQNRDRLQPLTKWNVKAGELALDLEYRTRVESDSNTNNTATVISDDFKEEGIAWENGFFGRYYWPINRVLELQGSFYVGYLDYPQGDGTEGLIADATTSNVIEVEMRLSERTSLFFLNNVDLSSYNFYDETENDTLGLRTFQNDAAVQLETEMATLHKLAIKAGVRTLRSITDDYDERDRNTYYGGLHWLWKVNSSAELGPYAAYRKTLHVRSVNNDVVEYEIGVGLQGKLTEFTKYKLSAGYQEMDFDTTHSPLATENGYGAIGSAAIYTELTERTRHALAFEVNHRIGSDPLINVIVDYLALYSVEVKFAENWTAKFDVTWLYADEISDNYGTRYDYYSGALEVIWQFAENASISVGGRYTEKDSRENLSDFKRDQAWVGMNWDF